MQITLNQKDISAAIQAHLSTQGINLANKKVDVNYSCTRKGGSSITAEVTISDEERIYPVAATAAVLVQPSPILVPTAEGPIPAQTTSEAPAEEDAIQTEPEVKATPSGLFN